MAKREHRFVGGRCESCGVREGGAFSGIGCFGHLLSTEEPATCKVPPPGWRCTRPAGHEGPCAAEPVVQPLERGSIRTVLAEAAAPLGEGEAIMRELGRGLGESTAKAILDDAQAIKAGWNAEGRTRESVVTEFGGVLGVEPPTEEAESREWRELANAARVRLDRAEAEAEFVREFGPFPEAPPVEAVPLKFPAPVTPELLEESAHARVPTIPPTDLTELPAFIRSGRDPNGHRWPDDTKDWRGYRCLSCGVLVEETFEGVLCPGTPLPAVLTHNGGVNAIGHSLTLTTEQYGAARAIHDAMLRPSSPLPPYQPKLPADTPGGTLVTLSGLAGVCQAAHKLLNELRRSPSGEPVDVFDVTQWALTDAAGQAAQELLLALRRAGV